MLRKQTIKYIFLLSALVCIIRAERTFYAGRYYYEEPVQTGIELVINDIPVIPAALSAPGITLDPQFSRLNQICATPFIELPGPDFYNNFILHQIKILDNPATNDHSLISILHKKNISHKSSETPANL